MSVEHVWLAIGLLGQVCYSARFLVQWIASERKKQSVVPIYFWYFSIGGGVMLLLYAIYRLDPVFMLGQSTGLIVYLRNLHLIHRQPRPAPEAASPPGDLAAGAMASSTPSSPA
jgi:lipid-A-disaccharide synthase-like uncharacterized protein